ncbi:MAG: lipopolysaccharide biosynthesis protein, partial [Bacteroidaceae bacterium]
NLSRVYSTTLCLVGSVALAFIALILLCLTPIATAMGYAEHPEYVAMMFCCVAVDAFQCIPFAYLRYQKRPIKFATLKLAFITINIVLNLLFFLVLPSTIGLRIDVGYAFAINLFCTLLITPCFYKELTGFRYVFDKAIARKMLGYSWPLLLLGIAGILNQTIDKIIFPILYPGHEGQVQLSIYGGCVKIAMIMAMITQAFRYAYEPFVFGKVKDKDNRDTYAKAMKYFLIFTLFAFLVVMSYMDLLRHLVGRDYWDGLRVVPIVMVAEIMMGIYFNLSFWYKIIDKTIWGAWFSGAGCLVLLTLNILFVPRYGYMACAWAGVAGYGTAMLLSYVVGQRKYPIAYPLGSMALYVAITALFTAIIMFLPTTWSPWLRMCVNTLLLLAFLAHCLYHDFPQLWKKLLKR